MVGIGFYPFKSPVTGYERHNANGCYYIENIGKFVRLGKISEHLPLTISGLEVEVYKISSLLPLALMYLI